MIPHIPESFFRLGWMVDWGLATVMGDTMPPRDPSDDDDDEEAEDQDDEPDDEPAVIREPDE